MEDNDKKGFVPSNEIERQQDQIEKIEDVVKDKTGLTLLSSKLGSVSKPIDENASVEDQIGYAEKKLREHHAHKKAEQTVALKTISNEDEKVDLEKVEMLLERSRLADALLQGHANKKTQIVFDQQVFGTVFHKHQNIVALNPQMTMGEAVFTIVRELRRAWLSSDGDILYPLAYEPDDAILLNRILEADASVIASWVAWDLKLQGFEFVWEYALSTNEALVVETFGQSAKENFRNFNNGTAAKEAFNAWFVSGMSRRCDHKLIQEMLADDKGYVFKGEEPSIAITSSLIDFIGELPIDRNYLHGMEEKPLPGSDYALVTDRSNANFLWFVKFERNFQETEKTMMAEERAEQEKKDNIEKSRNTSLDIAKIAKEDKTIIDFSVALDNREEEPVKKIINGENNGKVISLFGSSED